MTYSVDKKHFKRMYDYSLNFTQKSLGINLSQIEKVELRRTLEYTCDIYVKSKNSHEKEEYYIDPDIEASFIFMNKNYGAALRSREDYSKFALNKHEYKKELGFDPYPIYFQKRQDEMHLL